MSEHLTDEQREALCINNACSYLPYTKHSQDCRDQMDAVERIVAEVTAERDHDARHFSAEYDDACRTLDDLRAAVAALADEWEYPIAQYALRHEAAPQLRALLADPAAALQRVRAQEREAVLDEVERDLRWACEENPNMSRDFYAGLGVGIAIVRELREGSDQ